jgi:hypothetical protein
MPVGQGVRGTYYARQQGTNCLCIEVVGSTAAAGVSCARGPAGVPGGKELVSASDSKVWEDVVWTTPCGFQWAAAVSWCVWWQWVACAEHQQVLQLAPVSTPV